MSDSPTFPLPETLRYIAVEGVIGAGKTTLARMLARRTGARLVLEEFDENPFLPSFYQDPARWAFQTQLAFLASRFRQQEDLAARNVLGRRGSRKYEQGQGENRRPAAAARRHAAFRRSS